ncbi:MAG: hypothetical protein GXO15_00105 [Crenarchaeota archaeon]|nr:hypothetical protein [Thermoproteota archaeon]
MGKVRVEDLEVIERYEQLGETRFRVRVRGTILVVNVAANSEDEAKSKALELLERMGLDNVLEALREQP